MRGHNIPDPILKIVRNAIERGMDNSRHLLGYVGHDPQFKKSVETDIGGMETALKLLPNPNQK